MKLYNIAKFVLFFMLLINTQSVSAHSLDITSLHTDLQLSGNTIETQTTLPLPYDLELMEEEETRNSILESTKSYFKETFFIFNEKKSCILQNISLDLNGQDSEDTTINGTYICEDRVKNIDNLIIKSELYQDLSTVLWKHYLTIDSGTSQEDVELNFYENVYPNTNDSKKLITKYEDLLYENSSFIEPTNTDETDILEPNFWKVVLDFIIIGIEHILIGTDHILFIVVLVMLVVGIKNVLKLTITFTIAHSITLILASLGLITLTGKIVEPIIAISIVYIAIDNFLILKSKKKKKLSIKKQILITFLFGLFHGLGFAGVLREVDIPENYFVTSLLSFNIGVEIGQLLIIFILILPLTYFIRKYAWRDTAMQIISLIIALVAVYWFVERTIL